MAMKINPASWEEEKMSLCSTFVKAVDGKYYDDPVFRGEGYFVCFDDDDPPEIVISLERYRNPDPAVILQAIGIDYAKSSLKIQGRAGRCFTGEKKETQEAISYFFNLKSPIPVPIEFYKAVNSRNECHGCIEGDF
jgi:hypothetical protein